MKHHDQSLSQEAVISDAAFILLAPCQWGSHPDSRAYNLIVIFGAPGPINGRGVARQTHTVTFLKF